MTYGCDLSFSKTAPLNFTFPHPKADTQRYEYSQIDMAHLVQSYVGVECQIHDLEPEEGLFFFYQTGKHVVFPPSTLEEIITRFDKFYSYSPGFVGSIDIPLNTGGHWVVLRLLIEDGTLKVSYIDSLKNEGEGVEESREMYLQQLEEKLRVLSKRYELSLKTTLSMKGVVSGIEVNQHYIQPDSTSCGPITLRIIAESFNGIAAPTKAVLLCSTEIEQLRREQKDLLKRNDFRLDQDHTYSKNGVKKPKEKPLTSFLQTLKDLFGENHDPFGTSIFGVGDVKELSAASLDVIEEDSQSQSEDVAKRSLERCRQVLHHPVQLLEEVDQSSLPPVYALHFKLIALNQIIKSVREKQAQTTTRGENAAKNEHVAEEESFELANQLEELEREVKKAKATKQELQEKKEENTQLFYGMVVEIFKGNPPCPKDFLLSFHALINLNPLSLEPYYPFLTVGLASLDSCLLRNLLKKAQNISYYQTYGFVILSIRKFFKHKNPAIHFSVDESIRLLEALKEIYPQDKMIEWVMAEITGQPDKKRAVFSHIATSLTEALHALEQEDVEEAVRILTPLQPYLSGCSLLYRYLAFACCKKKDFDKAQAFLKRAHLLPNLHFETVSDELDQNINKVLEHLFPVDFEMKILEKEEVVKKTNKKNFDPLHHFVELTAVSGPLNLERATSFVETAELSLKKGVKELPFIYLGVKWLMSNLIIQARNSSVVYQPLIDALSRLEKLSLEILEKIDPQKVEMSQNNSHEATSTTRLQKMACDEVPKPTELLWEFSSSSLILSKASSLSLVTALTQNVQNLLVGFRFGDSAPRFLIEKQVLPIPQNPTMLISLLDAGLRVTPLAREETPPTFFKVSGLLNSYLEKPLAARPYSVGPHILDWAKLSVHTNHEPLDKKERGFLATQLGQEVRAKYYPAGFTEEGFLQQLKECNKGLTLFLDPSIKHPPLQFALRDALHAYECLCQRSSQNAHLILPANTESIYEVFEFSRKLYGWRLEETFDGWGKRLKEARKFELIGSNSHQTNSHVVRMSSTKLAESVPERVRPLLHMFLDFYLEFYEKTQEKNAHISSGGQETESHKKTSWHEDVKREDWIKIVKENSPQRHPKYHKDPEALKKLVQEKYEHEIEVKVLRNRYQEVLKLRGITEPVMLSSILLVGTEFDRKYGGHSVFAGTKANAERVARILLEVGMERILSHVMVKAVAEDSVINEISHMRELFLGPLRTLIGGFHGPEIHLENGPLQPHYNVAAVKLSSKTENTHIFFDEP